MAEVKAGAPSETSAVPVATPVNTATPSKKAPGLSFRRFFTKPGVSPYDEIEWETPHRPDHRRQGQRDLRAERCRSPQRLVGDRHQHRGQQISARHAGHARARDRRARTGDPRGRDHPRLGHVAGLLHARRKTAPPSTTSSRTSCCASTPPSTRRSGSTWAATASSPTPTPRTGTGTRPARASNSASPATRRRSARPASSTR